MYPAMIMRRKRRRRELLLSKFILPFFYLITGKITGETIHRLAPVISSNKKVKTTGPSKKYHQILDLPPSVKTVVINIGSNVDPILPQKEDGPCAISIAFEPIVGHLIKLHPQLYVINAAVSSDHGLAGMRFYNDNGASSSLHLPAKDDSWNEKRVSTNNGKLSIVPLISMHDVIASISSSIDIKYIRTDMQGHDFSAISSVGSELAERGIAYITTEVWLDDVITYQGTKNDLCRDWLPHMKNIGYELDSISSSLGKGVSFPGYSSASEAEETCKKRLQKSKDVHLDTPGLREVDAHWRLKTAKLRGNYNYPSLEQVFSSEEYALCE